jgi:hypothetical protein
MVRERRRNSFPEDVRCMGSAGEEHTCARTCAVTTAGDFPEIEDQAGESGFPKLEQFKKVVVVPGDVREVSWNHGS